MALTDKEFSGFMKVHMTVGVMLYMIYIIEISSFYDEFKLIFTDGGNVLFIIIFLMLEGGLIYSIYNMSKNNIPKLKNGVTIFLVGLLMLIIPLFIGFYEDSKGLLSLQQAVIWTICIGYGISAVLSLRTCIKRKGIETN